MNNDWNIALVFILAALIPGVIGLLVALAAARLGGLAIAMVTIALPIIGVPLAKRLSEFTGGSQGSSARFSAAPEWTGLYDDQWQLYIVIAIAGVVFLLTRNLVRGKYGRAFAIVKGNEAVASSMGISPYRYKVLAFTIASLIGGVSGFLYMVVVQYTSPETMSFGHSISLLAAMVIGGAGSILGSLLGGAYYVLAPQLTNAVDSSLTAVLQGIILLVILFVLPGGLVSLPRLWRRRKSDGRRDAGRRCRIRSAGGHRHRLAHAARRIRTRNSHRHHPNPTHPHSQKRRGRTHEHNAQENADHLGRRGHRHRRRPRRRVRPRRRRRRRHGGDATEGPAEASPGITDTSLTFGITSPLTGATAGPGNCTVDGALAYFGVKNAEGGIEFGDGKTRTIEIKAYDDGYDPQKALTNFQQMVSDGVFAAGIGLGTPTNRAWREAAIDEERPAGARHDRRPAVQRPRGEPDGSSASCRSTSRRAARSASCSPSRAKTTRSRSCTRTTTTATATSRASRRPSRAPTTSRSSRSSRTRRPTRRSTRSSPSSPPAVRTSSSTRCRSPRS